MKTMMFRRLAVLAWAGLLFCMPSKASVEGAAEAEPSAHVIPTWYATARTAPANPVQFSRVLAMVHVAMHDAVNSASPRYETYASDFIDRTANAQTAAAAAAHAVLSGLFPEQRDRWDAALADSLATIPDGQSKQAGVRLGAAIGQLILDVRANDGWNAVDPFIPPPAPGVWRPTPPAFSPMVEPQFRLVRPFTIVSGNQFAVPPPPVLGSVEYARLLNEVQSIGSDTSTTRSADQTHMAHFWYEPPYDSWSRIAGTLMADNHYDLHETARLYALVNMVSCDGLIAGFYWKRHYAFWRPITAIREADTDDNPYTIADPSWSSLRPAPAHPDHPSTHSVLGGAASEVVRRFTGSDQHKFCMTTLTATPAGSTRCFETFSQAQDENTNSRVYVGIHFRSAIVAGDALGKRIGRFAFTHVLRPLRKHRD